MNRRNFATFFPLMLALCILFWPQAGKAVDEKGAQPATKAAASATSPAITNINTATADELAKLPGIGPKTAEAIVKYRTDNGPFKARHDIVNVKGVGEKKFQALKDKITVGQEESAEAMTESAEKAAKGKAKKEMAQ